MSGREGEVFVLYDADCGFCAWCMALALRWDRRGRLRPVAIDSTPGQRLLAAMPVHERAVSWHVCDCAGRIASGGAALPAVLRRLPGGGAPAALTRRFPRVTERAYGWVAARRALFGRLVCAGARRRAHAVIAARMH